jgi:hypothetical protein
MSERHEGGTPLKVCRGNGGNVHETTPFLLYSDFSLPELGQSRPLGRKLDEEIFIAYDTDHDDEGSEKAVYWIGNHYHRDTAVVVEGAVGEGGAPTRSTKE